MEPFFPSILIIPLVLWSTFWKGVALWQASGRRQLLWFIILLVVNTVGLLEIAYIFYLYRFDLDQGKLLAFVEKKFAQIKKR